MHAASNVPIVAVFVVVCDLCPAVSEPMPLPEAEQTAGEHDHDRHHGEPTATIHPTDEDTEPVTSLEITPPPGVLIVAVCLPCQLYSGPYCCPDSAFNAAAAHQDERHHSEPTVTFHPAYPEVQP